MGFIMPTMGFIMPVIGFDVAAGGVSVAAAGSAGRAVAGPLSAGATPACIISKKLSGFGACWAADA